MVLVYEVMQDFCHQQHCFLARGCDVPKCQQRNYIPVFRWSPCLDSAALATRVEMLLMTMAQDVGMKNYLYRFEV